MFPTHHNTTIPLYPPKKDLYENIYTIPNALTLARIAATPVIGHFVLQGQFAQATALLFVAGVSDVVDGYLARRYNMRSVLGSILDPAADKFLMTTMVVTLAMKSMLPLPLAILIIGRDVALSISAFYFRYKSLPPPKSFTRFWDFSIPSAEVKPTTLSKYNTLLQLILVGTTTIQPLLPFELGIGLVGLQLVVAGTTIGSGLSYVFGRGVKYL
ncbi:BZ3500_MvSof-1268-A1-R1_Chr6-2g08484 [Microbotryum saponariae]|uniref:BZ3500_MvSof-1268-A1-R1_Chr6-2g08484 protein n=1 Tax=Microbotryum saponariae TaxID=289078 RepID=A0A2X0KK41_9BASI|nr:BZ3500_MvSof-1268-A1-R1_Chr6-2g08484 [Microbotryum saponariae]SDA07761.1 BZ3501_MvSof-1269-A2-R1_Chr6-1g08198 [Microbotryum saponariae]